MIALYTFTGTLLFLLALPYALEPILKIVLWFFQRRVEQEYRRRDAAKEALNALEILRLRQIQLKTERGIDEQRGKRQAPRESA